MNSHSSVTILDNDTAKNLTRIALKCALEQLNLDQAVAYFSTNQPSSRLFRELLYIDAGIEPWTDHSKVLTSEQEDRLIKSARRIAKFNNFGLSDDTLTIDALKSQAINFLNGHMDPTIIVDNILGFQESGKLTSITAGFIYSELNSFATRTGAKIYLLIPNECIHHQNKAAIYGQK